MKSITLLSPAKINLTLEILGKREDGYHEIRSIIQPVNLFDEINISIEQGEGIELNSKGLQVPKGENNLAWKAADILIKEGGIRGKINISLTKKIPLGAGLGGGSSNAAAVLVGLNRIKKKFSQDELINLSSKIGADVAFFINCKTAIVEGFGEKITLIRDFPHYYYLLLNPGFEVATKKIYECWDELSHVAINHTNIDEIVSLFKSGAFPLRNDLKTPATRRYPSITNLKERLLNLGVENASMTGSGPTVFSIFKEEKSAKVFYNLLKDSSSFKVFLVKGISGWHSL
ncbi:MAG: 4-(cytidine 5'-diphospho)-2-C-methyl-D-erythritol kinase [Thermodesulfobacteriota bacterium]